MPKKPAGLEQLLVEDLQDLLDAEKQLVRALPKIAKAVADEELESALREHLEVTKGHVQRIGQVFETMSLKARSRPCKGMKGIIDEGSEALQEEHAEGVLDAAITGGARKVEHYEMMGYEAAISLATQLGRRDAAQLLQETLREEMDADKKLAQISKRLVKEAASAAKQSMQVEPAKPKASRARQSSGAAPGRSQTEHGTRPLTDPDEIRNWAEERRAVPSCVRGTGGAGDTGMLRLNFPGFTGEESLEEISWSEWFDKFDESGLALLVQETTAGGQKSNFNKLVKRESVAAEAGPKTRSAH